MVSLSVYLSGNCMLNVFDDFAKMKMEPLSGEVAIPAANTAASCVFSYIFISIQC